LALLQVFLETGCLTDGLAGVLVDKGIRVTGISHTSSSNLGVLVEESSGGGSRHGAGESTGAGHKGEKRDNLVL